MNLGMEVILLPKAYSIALYNKILVLRFCLSESKNASIKQSFEMQSFEMQKMKVKMPSLPN